MRPLKVVAQLCALALVFALLGLLVWKLTTDDAAARVGDAAPVVDLPELDGTGRVKTSTFRGRIVVVNFWASWCNPCRDEAPLLEEAWRRHGDDGVVVLGVAMRDFIGDARGFVREFQLTYPSGYDGRGRLWETYGLTGLPETFVLDRNGDVAAHLVGPLESTAQLDEMIEQARA